MLSIKTALNHLKELNNSYIETEGYGFMEDSDYSKSNSMSKYPENKWNISTMQSAWNILNAYEEYLLETGTSIEQIERPESIENPDANKSENYLTIDGKSLKIENVSGALESQLLSLNIDFNMNSKNFPMSLDAIYKIIPFIADNTITISYPARKNLNLFLNNLTQEESTTGLKYELNVTLRPFQEIGACFLAINKRAILGDEMGLGKSIQSIAAVDILKAYPLLITCPSSIKFNWKEQIEKVIGEKKKITVLGSKTAFKDGADIYIVNYENLQKHSSNLKKIDFKSTIMDECHYLKNKDAKRSIICKELSASTNYRFLLTGTAVTKAPVDLVNQLDIIGHLDYFGGQNQFFEKFCDPKKTIFGTDYTGASNLNELAVMLRENCFLRRDKKDHLGELPEKTRTKLSVELEDAKTYKKSLSEFLKRDHIEKIRMLEDLRLYVAHQKIPALKEIIDRYIEGGQKVVVFAYHKQIQHKLLELYPDSCRIISDDPKIQNDNKNIFQENDDKKIIICSIKAAYMGFDLTSASNVVFAEMDWCSEINNQAEDRCHRMGQSNAVNAWYVIAQGTIEEHVWNVCERKRSVIQDIYAKVDSSINMDSIYSSVMDEVIELLEIENHKKDKEKAL